jgi:hypothetical protein
MNEMAVRGRFLALVFICIMLVTAADEASPVLTRLLRSDSRQALYLGRAADEEWDEFESEWRLTEDSLRTRPVRRVEIWTPFNRLAFGAREARLKKDREFAGRAQGLQRQLERQYRDELHFVVSYIVLVESEAESYRAELRPEKGDLMGPISSETLASFRWAGEYQMVRINYGFTKFLLGDWEGAVSLFLVAPSGESDGPWTFDLSKVR